MLPSASLIATRNRTATSDAINTVRNRSASGALFNVLIEHHEDVAAPSPRSTSPFIAPALLDAELRRDLESGRESVDSTISRPDSPAFLPSSSSSTNSSIGSVTSVSAIGSAATSPTPLIKSPRSRSPRASALLIGSRRSNTGVESLDVSPSTAALVAEASAAARALRMIDSRKPLSKSMGDLGQDVQELHFALHSLALQACPLTKDHALESIASLQGGEEAPTAPTPPPRGPVRAMTTAHGESLGYEWDRGSGSGGDTWRENLRKQWQEESLLSASTRKLEHSVSSSSLSTAIAAGATSPVTAPPSTSASSSNLSLSSSSSLISASGSLITGSDVASRRQTRKRLDMLRDQLEQRRVAMRALCVKAEAKVKELREREAQSRAQIKEHVDRYTAWHAIQLRQVYRSSAILQLVHLSLNRVIMERKAALLAQRAEELQRAVTAIRAGDNKPVPAELSEDTNALFNKPDINRAVTRIHRLGDAVVRLQPELVRLRNAANTEGITRVNRAKQLLEATPLVEGLPYHELNAQRQRAFDAILLDERYKEGKSILRMRRALIERAAEVTPADVVEFLEAFMAQVTTDWAVPAALGPRLRVYIQRAVFPLIWTDCAELLAQDSAASVADALLASRMAAIRSLSPTQMHLDPLYFAEGDPFSEATNTLNSLPYEVVPIDLLYILRKTMQQTLDALKRLQSVVKGIAADDILPAFIWVVARSDVACPNMHAVLMDAFSANADKMGEFGYCLTSYHAAVMHLGSLAQ